MTKAASPLPLAEFVNNSERFSSIVDQFIMSVTQSLCALEQENGAAMEAEENKAMKALILETLNSLDGMVFHYRNGIESIDTHLSPKADTQISRKGPYTISSIGASHR